jgi:hypothetical protein
MDKIEEKLTEAERLVYREEKRVNQLFRQALDVDKDISRDAMQELRKVFYEAKHSLEALQQVPSESRNYKELGRLTNLCKNVVALFNDMSWGLHERKVTAARPSEEPQQDRLPRGYRGLGD